MDDHHKVEDVKPDSAMEAEAKAAQQRALIPLEDRVQQFKEMLAEKEVLIQNISHSLHCNSVAHRWRKALCGCRLMN